LVLRRAEGKTVRIIAKGARVIAEKGEGEKRLIEPRLLMEMKTVL